MYAIFNRFCSAKVPEPMRNLNANLTFGRIDHIFANHFLDYFPQAVAINFGESAFLAIDDCPKIRMIESQEDVFCLFTGNLKNTAEIRKDLNLNATASDPHIITEMYKMSKKKGEHIVNSSLSQAQGSFSFILYDSSCDFVAVGLDADGYLPIFWGIDFDDKVVFANFFPLAVKRNLRSYAPFPAGCLYTNTDGLMKFKHPLSKLESVPWIDYFERTVRGVTFRIKDEIRGKYKDPKDN